MKSAPGVTGQATEAAACRHLQKAGLQLLDKNYRCRQGEIDLIMLDNDDLVFVEVRFRRHVGYGSGAESVTTAKQQKIIRAAQHFLACHQSDSAKACRFDVISVSERNQNYQFDWIKNAFQLPHGY